MLPTDTAGTCSVALEHVWLFVRGPQSVRIQRINGENGCALLVEGPDSNEEYREFPDLVACVAGQAEIERDLLLRGFFLEALTERRRGGERRMTFPGDRRRLLRFPGGR